MEGRFKIEEKTCWGYPKGDSFVLTEEESLQDIERVLGDEGLNTWGKHTRRLRRGYHNKTQIEEAVSIGIVAGAMINTAVESLSSLIKSNDKLSSEQISDKIIEIQFKILSSKWKNESSYISLVKKSFKLESYQEIIKMKERVIPFLLRELSETNRYWYEALKEITKQDPVNPQHYNDFKKMTQDWLDWGRKNGYYIL